MYIKKYSIINNVYMLFSFFRPGENHYSSYYNIGNLATTFHGFYFAPKKQPRKCFRGCFMCILS